MTYNESHGDNVFIVEQNQFRPVFRDCKILHVTL